MHNHMLFIGSMLAHWVASMSGIVSLSLGIVEYFRKQKIEAAIFAAVAILFLLVASDLAWQDEHRNSEVLIAEKKLAVEGENFWRDQSYRKDASIRSKDDLLAKNYSALIGEQSNTNKMQAAFAELSERVLSLNKPVKQQFTFRASEFEIPGGSWKHYESIFILTNAPAQASLRIVCQDSFEIIDASVANGGPHFPNAVNRLAPNAWEIRIPSPQMTPKNPLTIILGTDETGKQCQFDPL